MQQRGKEQQGQQHECGREHRRQPGSGAGRKIKRRARERAADRHRLAECCCDFCESLADQLLVFVPRRARLERNHFAARHRFHEADQRDHEARRQQRNGRIPIERRHAEIGQAARNFAHDPSTHLFISDQITDGSQDRHRDQHARQFRRQFFESEEQTNGGDAENQRNFVHGIHVDDDVPDIDQEMSGLRGGNAQYRR